MRSSTISSFFELIRVISAGTGIFLAFLIPNDPERQLNVLCLWVVVSLAGLTGIESVFFGQAAAEHSGYEKGSAYQRQSGLSNLALALTTLLIYILDWGLQAKVSLLIVLLVFLSFSSINHAYSALREHNTSLRNFFRPILTLLLLAMVIPFLLKMPVHT